MRRILTLISVIFISLFSALPVSALDFDSYSADVSWENAPEGTAYLDILIPLNESDEEYTKFNAPPRRISRGYLDKDSRSVYEYESLNINENSEITKYGKDGYVSMTLHYRGLRMMTVNGNDKEGYFDRVKQELSLYRDTAPNIAEIYEKYGDLKAAYVDENGRVLDVTESFEVIYDNSEPYALVASGDKLTLRIFGSGASTDILTRFGGAVFLAAAIIVIALLTGTIMLLSPLIKSSRVKKSTAVTDTADKTV